MNHDNMPDMMDFGNFPWIFMIIGAIGFVILLFVLRYILTHRPYNQSTENKQTQKAPPIDKTKVKSIIFCPGCGVKLETKTIEFCPTCGTKI